MFSSGPTSQSGLKRGLPLLDTGEIAHTCVLGLALRQRASSPWHEVKCFSNTLFKAGRGQKEKQ